MATGGKKPSLWQIKKKKKEKKMSTEMFTL